MMTLDELYEKVYESGSPLERSFIYYWKYAGGDHSRIPEWQYQFDPTRKWRFDFCFPKERLAIEIQGGVKLTQGGRHNTDTDRWKMVEAAAQGWRVMGISGEMLNGDPFTCITVILRGLEWRP